MSIKPAFLLAVALAGAGAGLLAGCHKPVDQDADRPVTARGFPRATRPVSHGAGEGSNEAARDQRGEANAVMALAGIGPGLSVADIGAGEGYYTVRLAAKVGAKGRVLAQDIDAQAIQKLGLRVERERLDNVSISLGTPDDPRLPDNSFDRIFLVHMYHEVTEPYAFLWRLRPALKPGGQVVVVDTDDTADHHGLPPRLLFCEFASLGFRLTEFIRKPELTGYYAQFEAAGPRPAPQAIKPCKWGGVGPAGEGGTVRQ